MRLAELRTLVKSVPYAHHAGFVALLTGLSFLSLSALGIASSFYGLYYDIASPGEGGLVISSYSVSPITSVVGRKYVEELVGNATGIEIEFAVFSPVLVGGEVAVVRGLEEGGLRKLLGSELPSEYCVVVGRGLAGDLGIEEGAVIPLYSVFTRRVFLVHVCSTADLPEPHSFEILSNVELARELRGLSKDSYSIATVRSEDPGVLSSIAARLGLAPEEASILRRALLVLTQRGGRIAPEVRQDLPEVYISRLGVHRDFLYYFAYAVAAVAVLCLPIVGEAFVRATREPANVLRLLGVPRARLSLVLGVVALAFTFLALTLATFAIKSLSSYIALRVLSYQVTPVLGVGEAVVVALLQLALLMLGVVWGVREYVE